MRRPFKIRAASTIRILPWILALIGLAIPMIGSGFISWPFALGWLAVLVAIWLVRPVDGVDSFTRRSLALGAVLILLITGSMGGWYLLPALVAWLGIDLLAPASARRASEDGDRLP
jgi:hypothetical protein